MKARSTTPRVSDDSDKLEFPVEIQIKGKIFLTFLFSAL